MLARVGAAHDSPAGREYRIGELAREVGITVRTLRSAAPRRPGRDRRGVRAGHGPARRDTYSEFLRLLTAQDRGHDPGAPGGTDAPGGRAGAE